MRELKHRTYTCGSKTFWSPTTNVLPGISYWSILIVLWVVSRAALSTEFSKSGVVLVQAAPFLFYLKDCYLDHWYSTTSNSLVFWLYIVLNQPEYCFQYAFVLLCYPSPVPPSVGPFNKFQQHLHGTGRMLGLWEVLPWLRQYDQLAVRFGDGPARGAQCCRLVPGREEPINTSLYIIPHC